MFQKIKMPFFWGIKKFSPWSFSLFLFEISQLIHSLEPSKVLAKLGHRCASWLSYSQFFFVKFAQTNDEQMLKISRRYLDSCLMNIFERLRFCWDQWTPVGQYYQKWATGVYSLQQIFSHLAITQIGIKKYFWNFKHLFIMCLYKIDKSFFVHNSISLPAMAYFDQNFWCL